MNVVFRGVYVRQERLYIYSTTTCQWAGWWPIAQSYQGTHIHTKILHSLHGCTSLLLPSNIYKQNQISINLILHISHSWSKLKHKRMNGKPELADPLKVIYTWHILLHQFSRNILRVDFYDDDGREHSSLYLRQLSPHQLHQVTELQRKKEKTTVYTCAYKNRFCAFLNKCV